MARDAPAANLPRQYIGDNAPRGNPSRQRPSDKFIARYGAPCPNYLKINVPGFTQEIFAGAWKTLANPALRQIQEESEGGRRIAELLAQLGFKLGRAEDQARKRELVFARTFRASMPQQSWRLAQAPRSVIEEGRRNLPGKLKVLSRETRFISGR